MSRLDRKPSPTRRDTSAMQASSSTEATAAPTRSFRNDGYGPHKAQAPPWPRGCRHPTSGDLHAICLMSGCSEIEAGLPGMSIEGADRHQQGEDRNHEEAPISMGHQVPLRIARYHKAPRLPDILEGHCDFYRGRLARKVRQRSQEPGFLEYLRGGRLPSDVAKSHDD